MTISTALDIRRQLGAALNPWFQRCHRFVDVLGECPGCGGEYKSECWLMPHNSAADVAPAFGEPVATEPPTTRATPTARDTDAAGPLLPAEAHGTGARPDAGPAFESPGLGDLPCRPAAAFLLPPTTTDVQEATDGHAAAH
jgi:hypothetical protein